MDKNIYNLLNKTETNLDDYHKENLTDIEYMKMTKHIRTNKKENNSMKKLNFKNTAIIAATVSTLMIGSLSGVSFASLQNPTAYKIASFLGIEKNLDAYETVVNKSITKEDVTIQLAEVVINQDELWVSVVSSSEKYTSDQMSGPGGTAYINGEEINRGAMWENKILDSNTVQSLIKFPLGKVHEGNLDVKLVLSTPLNGDLMPKSPHWTFEFNVNGDNLRQNTLVKEINQNFILPNGTKLNLTRFSENSISAGIEFTLDGELSDQYITILAVDEFGNTAKFTPNGIVSTEGKFVLNQDDAELISNSSNLTLSVMLDNSQIGDSFSIIK